jgi:hypothetical protein
MGLLQAFHDFFKTSLPPDGIIGFFCGAIQGEGQKINIVAGNFIQDIMKEIPVGINGNGFEAGFFRRFDSQGKIRVEGGFSTEKNEIGCGGFIRKKGKPGLNRPDIKGIGSVLFLIDIAMDTGKVAFGQDMKKKIG